MTSHPHRASVPRPPASPLHRYTLAGRAVDSDIELCELAPRYSEDAPAVRIHAADAIALDPASTLRTVGDPATERGWIRIERDREGLRWVVGGLGTFRLSPAGDEVRYTLDDDHDPGDAEQALVGPVLGTALQLQGVLTLHASTLVCNGAAFALSAPSGLGKSTLATALTRRGASLMSDDVAPVEPVDGGWITVPYLPRLKLWEDSLDAFGLPRTELARVASWAEKRRFSPPDAQPASTASAPLAAIYLLAPTTEDAPAEVAALDSVDAVLAVQGALYQPDLLTAEQSVSALAAVVALATAVPVRRLTLRRGYEWLDEACDALLADLEVVGERAP